MKPKAIWTHPEDLIIRKAYRRASDAELLAMLPGKSLSQIKSHASYLGVKRGFPVGGGKMTYQRYKTDKIDPQGVDKARDAIHVKACIKAGGFPFVHLVNGRAEWVWPVGRMAA